MDFKFNRCFISRIADQAQKRAFYSLELFGALENGAPIKVETLVSARATFSDLGDLIAISGFNNGPQPSAADVVVELPLSAKTVNLAKHRVVDAARFGGTATFESLTPVTTPSGEPITLKDGTPVYEGRLASPVTWALRVMADGDLVPMIPQESQPEAGL